MPYQVDPLFETRARQSRARRRRRTGARIGAGTLVLCFTTGVAWYLSQPAPTLTATEEDFALVQSEETAAAAIDLDRSASFVDLRRDPMILRLAEGNAETTKTLAADATLAPKRLIQGGPAAVTGLRDRLFVAERRLRTRLPSTHDDFALFNAQRRQGTQEVGAVIQAAAVPQGREVSVREDSSWGDLVGGASEATAAVYVETRIENTTSVAVVRSEGNRDVLFKDDIIVLQAARDLRDVLIAAGVTEDESAATAQAAKRIFFLEGLLAADSLVALRLRPDARAGQVMLMSIYTPQGYLASLAQVGAGRFEKASDPWVEDDLMSRSGKVEQADIAPGEMRLLDAVYAAGIRNGLSTKLVGEMIVLLSKQYDLERFVADGDELVVLTVADAGRAGLGALLYAGIHTQSEVMPCYVMASEETDGFSCFDFNRSGGGPVTGGLGGGFVLPVKGVKTSGFGPRRHPILKQVRNHNGVDWAAPTGTPVFAAAAGRVTRRGVNGGYGNVIYLDHVDGVQTRYAHLNAFAKGITEGSTVAAGEKIGYVGTTGRSTGPHLHFELWVAGRPFDPLSYRAGTGGEAQAVDALVDQIIRVESAGIATAKNPLSTATGLGQFIQSTWLRMMRDYRPDLVRDLDKAALLALRTDPALSREMVRNLARENESFLRARGHRINAGRLYLAHFLGPEGAHRALGADVEASVLSVMGKRVVDANPFLRGKNIGALQAWAQRKMGRRGPLPAKRARVIPPEAVAYRKGIDELLEEL